MTTEIRGVAGEVTILGACVGRLPHDPNVVDRQHWDHRLMSAWGWVGFGFQLAALVLAGLGVWDTWAEFRHTGRHWVYVDRLTIWGRWIGVHILRRRRHVSGSASSTIAFISSTAEGRLGFVPLPDIVTSPEAFGSEVQTSITRLLVMIQDARSDLTKDIVQLKQEARSLREHVDSRSTELDEQVREVQFGGLRMEAIALVLVIIGTLFQAWS